MSTPTNIEIVNKMANAKGIYGSTSLITYYVPYDYNS